MKPFVSQAKEEEIHVGDFGITVPVVAGPDAGLDASGVAAFAEFIKPTSSLVAVLLDDGGVFTDLTAKAKDVKADDTILLPALPVVNDAIYFMARFRFGSLFFDLPTPGVGTWVLTWDYFNTSDAWVGLAVVDDTNSFTDNTPNDFELPALTFGIPPLWKTVVVDGVGPFWAIRARVTTGDPSVVTQPLASQVRLGPVELIGTVTNTVKGEFSVTIPKGLFDEPGEYRLHSRIEGASPSSRVRGNLTQFSVKERGAH